MGLVTAPDSTTGPDLTARTGPTPTTGAPNTPSPRKGAVGRQTVDPG